MDHRACDQAYAGQVLAWCAGSSTANFWTSAKPLTLYCRMNQGTALLNWYDGCFLCCSQTMYGKEFLCSGEDG